MASTGKIFDDSSNIYQDQAKLLFNYYEQAAERVVRQEEALEKQIQELKEDRDKVELQKSGAWKWLTRKKNTITFSGIIRSPKWVWPMSQLPNR